MSAADMSEKLWDLANLITGFAVLQTLATIFALIKKGGEIDALKGAPAHLWAFVATFIFTVLYVGAIIWCRYAASPPDGTNNAYVWNVTTFGRVSIVLIFTGIMCVALWGHWRSVWDPEHWRFRAEEARTVADQMTHEEARTIMRRIANDYDRLAKLAEEQLVAQERGTPGRKT